MAVLGMLKPSIRETGRGFHELSKTQQKFCTLADFCGLMRVGILDFYKAATARSFVKWAKIPAVLL